MRTGAHPLSAILWLKHQESLARGIKIDACAVTANMAQVTNMLDAYEHRHIAARPNDVEDEAMVIVEFTDGTRAVVIATDTLLGGSKNYVEVYGNDIALVCKLTMNNLMSTYLLDEDGLDDVYLSEMLPTKKGWNNPFISDEVIRGYRAEMQDFMECIVHDKQPMSEFGLAYETTMVMYAAYLSSEKGMRIEL